MFLVNSPLQEKCFLLCVLLTLLAVMGYLGYRYCMKGYSKVEMIISSQYEKQENGL